LSIALSRKPLFHFSQYIVIEDCFLSNNGLMRRPRQQGPSLGCRQDSRQNARFQKGEETKNEQIFSFQRVAVVFHALYPKWFRPAALWESVKQSDAMLEWHNFILLSMHDQYLASKNGKGRFRTKCQQYLTVAFWHSPDSFHSINVGELIADQGKAQIHHNPVDRRER
jgi:hypothetical protein